MAAVIVHGGAYAIPDAIAGACKEGCRTAAEKGYEVLKEGKSALDAGKIAPDVERPELTNWCDIFQHII